MYPVIYINCDLKNRYNKYNFFSRVKDNLSMRLLGESFIGELGLEIAQVKLPPNFNKQAYMKNIEGSRKFVSSRNAVLSPKTLRLYDYSILNSFQRDLLTYSVVKSIQLILRMQNKSIKNSCILINNAHNDISFAILKELAKYARYIILVSKSVEKMSIKSDYIMSNYGITPVVTNDIEYAVGAADFIVTDKEINANTKTPVWQIDNDCVPEGQNKFTVNDVSFKVPWDTELSEMPPELLGGILGQMSERDIEKSLKYNGIYLDKIKFNERILEI
jgi:hypothetical protein